MDLDQALLGVETFLYEINYPTGEDNEAYWVGLFKDHVNYVYKYAKTMRATPTTHDSNAEMKHWDDFKEEGKARSTMEFSATVEELSLLIEGMDALLANWIGFGPAVTEDIVEMKNDLERYRAGLIASEGN